MLCIQTNEVDETCNSLLLIRFDGGWSKRCYNRNTSSLTRRVDYDLHENEYEDNEQNDIGIDAGGMNYPLEVTVHTFILLFFHFS